MQWNIAKDKKNHTGGDDNQTSIQPVRSLKAQEHPHVNIVLIYCACRKLSCVIMQPKMCFNETSTKTEKVEGRNGRNMLIDLF